MKIHRLEEDEMKEKKKTSSFAIISIVFGMLGFVTSCFCGGILGIIGLVFGIFVFLYNMDGKNLAWVGVIASGFSILITILTVLAAVAYLKDGGYEEMNKMMYEFNQQMGQQQIQNNKR